MLLFQVVECFVLGAKNMEQDGWWWHSPKLTNKAIKRKFLYDMLMTKFPITGLFLPAPMAVKVAESDAQVIHE